MTTLNRVLVVAAVVATVGAIGSAASAIVLLRATEIAVFVVAFSGLHILSGRLGLISVGHGAFIAIGAVAGAHAIDDAGVPYLLAPLVGAVAGAAFGVVIGIPSLRLPGAYLALLTLAVAMVLPIALRRIDGPLGYRVDGDIRPPAWTGLPHGEEEVWQFILVAVVGAGIMVVVHGAIRGRFTRSLLAVRDNPTAAAAFGVNVSRTHLIGVAISAGLAGAAGGLQLYATPLVSGEQYPFSLSVAMFALMVALGASRIWTGIPAAIILVALPEILIRQDLAVWEPIIYAAILLLMTRVSRGKGLVSLLDRPGLGFAPATAPARPVGPAAARTRPQPGPEPAPAAAAAAAAASAADEPQVANPWLLTPEPTSAPNPAEGGTDGRGT